MVKKEIKYEKPSLVVVNWDETDVIRTSLVYDENYGGF